MRNFLQQSRIIALFIAVFSMVIAPAVSSYISTNSVMNISCECCCSIDLEKSIEMESCKSNKSQDSDNGNLSFNNKDTCCCSLSDQTEETTQKPVESNLPSENKNKDNFKSQFIPNSFLTITDITNSQFHTRNDIDIGLSSSPPLFLINSSFLI